MDGEEKVKGLMHYCINWGEEGCHPDVCKHEYPKELKEGEEIPIWPVGEEQERLDKICRQCKYRFFEIEKNECPICREKPLPSIPFAKIKDINLGLTPLKEKVIAEQFFYQCSKCETKLYSFKEL